MPARYVVSSMVLSSRASIDITKDEHDALLQAVERLLHCTDVEEKFDCLIENYRELEEYLLTEALRAIISFPRGNIEFQLLRSKTSRKLSNFLSSARLYCSTIETHAAAIIGNNAASDQIKAAMSRQFDASLNYRVMDALRNYAQHAALPVHTYAFGGSWTPDRKFLEHEVDPGISVADLAIDPAFKRKTLNEIIDRPPTLKLKPMVRDYIEGLSTVHREFRDLTSTAIDRYAQKIEQVKHRMKAQFSDTPDVGFATFEVDEAGNMLRPETALSNVLDEYLQFLKSKTDSL